MEIPSLEPKLIFLKQILKEKKRKASWPVA
jgi:hypothetical protein